MGQVVEFRKRDDGGADERMVFFDPASWRLSKRRHPYWRGAEHLVTLKWWPGEGWTWMAMRCDDTGVMVESVATFASDSEARADAWLWRAEWPEKQAG